MTKSWKNTAEKEFFSNFCNLLYIPYRPPYRTSKLQEKPSALKREHPALQNKFVNTFFYYVGHFCLPGSATLAGSLEAGTHLQVKHLIFTF
jgi:hypothetical protein